MPTSTYDLIASNVLGSSAASVTFSSIPATYRDLVLVTQYLSTSTNTYAILRFNSDSGSNYQHVYMSGSSGSTYSGSGSFTGVLSVYWTAANSTGPVLGIYHIMDSSATDKHKTVLSRTNTDNTSRNGVEAFANRWANTAAITQIDVVGGNNNFAAGSSFHLYGISA